ncbi:oxygen-independent coproporphyrinogen III oxidase [Salipiger thiooxidans]|uniref:oxygen-independent coproporphyrinogen III oxidase n=1 Tax=Salipiger thiooxidans TaxID=282683 RepID=UPI001CD3263A|nr:oxygen-independent coproporphyrinogen III oxidase [Salipiger thiooxidans]MCA0851338.1 oxygen-independent coproporphyrinogen III oxidase [Salipiger thiooxidans]
MKQIDRLRSFGLFETRVPRYTSYPTAPVFSPDVGAAEQATALAALNPADPVSAYIHIPFCERLCRFCACRTQGTKTLSPVESYIGTLEQELALLARTLPDGLRMGRMHWAGGTPTILPPHLIHRLARAVRAIIPPTADHEFSVEIDPTMVDPDMIVALAEEGMNRASIGIQDFNPKVQEAIGRIQPFDITKACVDDLRAAGIHSLNADLVYGLPHQDLTRLDDTITKVLELAPDRLAIFGYAHVPRVSKRQQLIDGDALPKEVERYELARLAAQRFIDAGFHTIGSDHFARPGDTLARAARSGLLRRNFQGCTDDTCPTLLGLGASSISRLLSGYVQNAPATGACVQRIESGTLAGSRGHVMTEDDLPRARVIEMLMCDFRVNRPALRQMFGDTSNIVDPMIAQVATRFRDYVELSENYLDISHEGRPLTRIIASWFDAYVPDGVKYSQAS